jgi:hypothetical protein
MRQRRGRCSPDCCRLAAARNSAALGDCTIADLLKLDVVCLSERITRLVDVLGQRLQGDGLESVVPWRAKERTVDGVGYEDPILLVPQELDRCALQLRSNPDIATIEKGAECVECAAVQSDTDRAVELLHMPDCVPPTDQSLCPRHGLRSLGKCYAK